MAAEVWAPSLMPGLWVIADYQPRRGWARTPYARLTCPYGCHFEEHGDAGDVARFVAAVAFVHSRRCPGPPVEESHV